MDLFTVISLLLILQKRDAETEIQKLQTQHNMLVRSLADEYADAEVEYMKKVYELRVIFAFAFG